MLWDYTPLLSFSKSARSSLKFPYHYFLKTTAIQLLIQYVKVDQNLNNFYKGACCLFTANLSEYFVLLTHSSYPKGFLQHLVHLDFCIQVLRLWDCSYPHLIPVCPQQIPHISLQQYSPS